MSTENPRLGPEYPYLTWWRCPRCLQSALIADAGEREWCMECPDAHPLRLVTRPGAPCPKVRTRRRADGGTA